jgi:heme A synthase
MRRAFAALATLLVLAVVAQFFFAASGAFDTGPKDESFQMHRTLGYGILLFAVLLTVFAALARMPGRLIGMAGLLAGLTLLQGVIRAIAAAFDETANSSSMAGELVFGLHALNALIIMAVAGMIVRQARAMSNPAAEPAQPVS